MFHQVGPFRRPNETPCIWDAFNVNAIRTKALLTSTEKCSNHEFPLQQLQTRQGESSRKELPRGLTDMKGRANKCVERHCELANKKQSSCTKSQLPAWVTITSRGRNWSHLEDCQKFAHGLFLFRCLYLARMGRPDVVGSVNKLARAVTKSTGACDK